MPIWPHRLSLLKRLRDPPQVQTIETSLPMHVWPHRISPLKHGSRGQRWRWHFVCWAASSLSDRAKCLLLQSQRAFLDECQRLLTATQIPKQPLSCFMLPAGHPQVQRWLATVPSCDNSEAQLMAGWVVQHQSVAAGLQCSSWPVRPQEHPALKELATGRLLQTLTPRQRDGLCLTILQKFPKLPQLRRTWAVTDHDVFVDVEQGIGRMPIGNGNCPVVLPNSLLVSLAQQRLVTPIEHALFHGWNLLLEPVGLAPAERTRKRKASGAIAPVQGGGGEEALFSWREVQSLFGNSFNGYSVAASLLTGLVFYRCPHDSRLDGSAE